MSRTVFPFFSRTTPDATFFAASLDNIGNDAFSHDFGCLKGKTSRVMAAFDSFQRIHSALLQSHVHLSP